MTIRRQHFIPEPGESLLISSSAALVAARFDAFVTESGIDPELVLSDPLSTTPLPIYTKNTDGTLARLAVAPTFLWHPLAWLPETLALRLQIRDNEADVRLESDHEWVLRVGLEMQAAGLYDPEEGWVDILALHELDIDNPVDLARVEAWAAGEPDSTLDGIDLAKFLVVNDEQPDWAYHSAAAFAEVYIPAQWSLMAGSLLDLVDTQVYDIVDQDEKRQKLGIIVPLAWDLLADAPAESEFERAPEDQLLDIIASLDDPAVAPFDAQERLRLLLIDIRDGYSMFVDALDDEQPAATPQLTAVAAA